MPSMTLEVKIAQFLTSHKKTLAVAESCSGGLLGHRITQVPGSSHFFIGGFITYSNASKITLLKVPVKILKEHGSVSEAVSLEMARRARMILKTDYGVGITGIAGPGGGSKNKPVGLTYIAVAGPRDAVSIKCCFKGSREKIKEQATTQALKLLREFM